MHCDKLIIFHGPEKMKSIFSAEQCPFLYYNAQHSDASFSITPKNVLSIERLLQNKKDIWYSLSSKNVLKNKVLILNEWHSYWPHAKKLHSLIFYKNYRKKDLVFTSGVMEYSIVFQNFLMIWRMKK